MPADQYCRFGNDSEMTAESDQITDHEAGDVLPEETVEEFKDNLYKMQQSRRSIVESILSTGIPNKTEVEALHSTLRLMKDRRTDGYQRHITAANQRININLKDEIEGLDKDIAFLDKLCSSEPSSHLSIEEILTTVDLPEILAKYHPKGKTQFYVEMEQTLAFLTRVLDGSPTEAKLALITDWDGTMKNYCSQYATNLQPIYSAIGLALFAQQHTRLSAVLTAGPLRGPGILDLTSLNIDGPVVFSGSWGREWWLHGRRVVYDDGISDEGVDALNRLNDEMRDLLSDGEYSQFGLVGSGVQRKVDRLTLGVQTVCNQVESELSTRYQEAVRERMHRVDPNQQILTLESNDLEVEVVCKDSRGEVWNKGDGVKRLMAATKQSLAAGRVLIAGDTTSDLPMLEYAMKEECNPEGTFALFVGDKEIVKRRMEEMVGDVSRTCYIACPDVFHAALSKLLVASSEVD